MVIEVHKADEKRGVNSLCNKRQSVSAPTVLALRFVMWFSSTFFTCTVIFSDNLRAFFTLDCAAPVKFAIAAADDLNALLHHSEAALIAQPAAALFLPLGHVLVALQALPSLRALQSQALVLDAVIRRILQVNELRSGDAPKSVRDGSSVVCAVPCPRRLLVHLQFLSIFVLHLEVVAHFSEVGQLHPTGLDAAASRHAVTLAGFPHCSFDCLPRDYEC